MGIYSSELGRQTGEVSNGAFTTWAFFICSVLSLSFSLSYNTSCNLPEVLFLEKYMLSWDFAYVPDAYETLKFTWETTTCPSD